jgi:hypothetical protein
MTLTEILAGTLSCDSSFGIWAEKIGGEFTSDSPARFGQVQFENSGLLDGMEFFSRNDLAVDSMSSYLGNFEPWEMGEDGEWQEWIRLYESDAGNDGESPCEWGGRKSDIVDYVQEHFGERYESMYQKHMEHNANYLRDAAENLIAEVNEGY